MTASLSLLLASALLGGCGSDPGSNPNSAFQGVDQSQVYRGFVLGRVKLIPALQAGPVEVLTMDGQLIHTAQAAAHGFFHYRDGILPPDFRLRARRGNNTYEAEYHGGWHGGTLYINAGTTLTCAYLRTHLGVRQPQAEEKIRRFFGLPDQFPMSWVSTVRAPGFDTPDFFQKVQSAGSLDSYLNVLLARIDSGVLAKEGSLIGDLATQTAESIFSATVNDVAGDTVAHMGNDFTTAGALSTIENDLVIVSAQITELNQEFEKAAAAAALQATLAPLKSDALQINDAVVNITDTIQAFIQTHPDPSYYNVPSSYPAIQSTIGQVNSLNLANLTNPILTAVTNTGSQGIYQLLVKEQMTNLGQTETSFNNYPWRSNQLTTQQLQMMGSFVTSLQQSAYLQAEYGSLQTNDLAAAITQASRDMADIAYQIQLAAQQVPDLLPVDEVILDPGNQHMWFSAFLGSDVPDDAVDFVSQLEVGPYDDFGFPQEADMNNLIRKRIGPATSPQISTLGSNTWNDVNFGIWSAAFVKMGIDASSYTYETQADGATNNEGCYYSSKSFSTSKYNPGDIDLYEWNGTGNNPSTTPSDPVGVIGGTPSTNILAMREVGSAPESNAGGYLPPPLTVGPHSGDSVNNPDNHVASFVISGISPFQCAITSGPPAVTLTGNTVSANGAALGYQIRAFETFQTVNGGNFSSASNTTYDVTQRVAWSTNDSSVASISNYLSNTTTDSPDFRVPGGCGFLTWHPPLDGSAPGRVTITAKLFSLTSTNGSATLLRSTDYTLDPPTNCRPFLSGAYATPNNQIVDLSHGSATIPITLLAYYQDGRVVDVSTDANTTWTLKDSNGTVLNSLNSGGFGVQSNTGKNVLFLSDPISTANVTYTGSYSNQWGAQSFTGTMGLIHTPLPVTINTILPAVGPSTGGQTLVIKGANFTNPSIVFFNGVPATSTFFVTSSQLSVVTPPGSAGAASVVVTTSQGNSSNAAFYNYTP